MNLGNCARLPQRPRTGVWYRAVEPQYLPLLFKTAYSKLKRGRFSLGQQAGTPFELFYLAENPQVGLFEVEALFGDALTGDVVANPSRAWVTVPIEVQLQHVADLTESVNQQLLQTSAQELTGDWSGYHYRSLLGSIPQPVRPAPTQELGQELFGIADLEAFETVSARIPVWRNLVIFPQKLKQGSYLRYRKYDTGEIMELSR